MEEIQEYWDRQPCGVLRPPEWRYIVQPHIPAFADFKRWNGKRVLEIGCGIGVDTKHFEREGAEIVGIDLSQESLLLAAERTYEALLLRQDAEKLFSTFMGYFDLVYSFGVIHHTPNPKQALENAYIYLKSGGELRIMLYAKNSLKHWLGHQPEAQAGCPLVRWYTKSEARKLVESAGFKVTSITKTHIFPYKLIEYKQDRLVKLWVYRLMPQFMFRWLEHMLGHHLLIVADKP